MTNQNTQQKAMIRILLFMTGIMALIMATFCLAMPSSVEDMVGLDHETVNIVGYVLTAVGLGDLVVSLIIFKQRDKK